MFKAIKGFKFEVEAADRVVMYLFYPRGNELFTLDPELLAHMSIEMSTAATEAKMLKTHGETQ